MTDKNPLAHYSGVLSEAVQESAAVPDQAQIKALMRKHRIWIEHSTLLEEDEPARELRAVQAEQHQFEAFVQDLIALSATKTTPESDYLEGVSIPNLREALIFLGRENGVGEGQVGDKLAQYVNSVVSGVLAKKATLREAAQAAPAAVAVPDFENWRKSEYPWLGPIGDGVQIAREAWNAALAATPAAAAPDMVTVTKEDANNYCRILTALGMEEEGDPVAEVQNLLAAAAAPVVRTIPQPFGYVVTTPAGVDLFYRHPADLIIHNDHRAETVYTLPEVLAAVPKVLPEHDAVISEVMGLVEKASVQRASMAVLIYTEQPKELSDKAAIQERDTVKLIESKLLALLAGVSAPAAQAVERIVHLRVDRQRRIYVAGPMTGLPEFNFPAFNSAADKLRAEEWHVENPAEHGHIEGADWADYLRWDISRIATCGAIYLLPGWEGSKGATLEVSIAKALGMQFVLAPGAAPQAQADARDAVLAHLDGLLDDAAAHIYPSDLNKLQTGEHTATVASVRMGNRSERSVPLYSREQVVEAFDAAQAAQQGDAA